VNNFASMANTSGPQVPKQTIHHGCRSQDPSREELQPPEASGSPWPSLQIATDRPQVQFQLTNLQIQQPLPPFRRIR
jgi:hypothetical protein